MTPSRPNISQRQSEKALGLRLADSQVFFDFDNTIAAFDVLDGIIERFSVNRDWVVYEEAWKKGKIGSRQCLEGQLRSIRVSRPQLHAYLETVAIDPWFGRLLNLQHRLGMRPVIVSDSFSQIIRYVLEHNGVSGVPIYANSLRIQADRLIPSFPRAGSECLRCGHCKTSTLADDAFAGKSAVYVGDGLSDLCPARRADLVFAKRGCSLHRQLLETSGNLQPFDDLGDVYVFFKEFTNECNALSTCSPDAVTPFRAGTART